MAFNPIWTLTFRTAILYVMRIWIYPIRILRTLVAIIVCGIALLLPYKARLAYFSMVAFCVHLPFYVFGHLAKFILKKLDSENPYAS